MVWIVMTNFKAMIRASSMAFNIGVRPQSHLHPEARRKIHQACAL